MGKFEPQERALAMSLGEKRYFTGRPCKNGHLAERLVSNGVCVVCQYEKTAKRQSENREAMKAHYRRSYAKHAEKRKAYSKRWRAENPEKVKLMGKRDTAAKKAAHAMRQRVRDERLRLATPVWLTSSHKAWMKSIYMASCEMPADTTVDHIVPLRGKNVCGLHVPWNLRVTSRSYNSRKSNKQDEVPEYQERNTIMVHRSAMPWEAR